MRLTEEQILLRDTARDVAQNLLAPGAAERDREARFPKDELVELGKLGFMGALVPPEWGGAGADHVGYALALEEIAAGAILYAAETATKIALDAVQILGGNGYINDYPTGRLLRDAKLYEIGAGTSEIRRMLIGRELFNESL